MEFKEKHRLSLLIKHRQTDVCDEEKRRQESDRQGMSVREQGAQTPCETTATLLQQNTTRSINQHPNIKNKE